MPHRILSMKCQEESAEGINGSYQYNCTPENMRIAQQAFNDDYPQFPDVPFGEQLNYQDGSKPFRGSFAETDLWHAYNLFVIQRLEVERIDAQVAYEARVSYRPSPPFENHPGDPRHREPYPSNTMSHHDHGTLQRTSPSDMCPQTYHDTTLTALRPSYRPFHQDNHTMHQPYPQLTHSDAEPQQQNVNSQLQYVVPSYPVVASQQQMVTECYQQQQYLNVSTTQQIQHPYIQGYQHSISVRVSNQQQVSTVQVPAPVYQQNGQQIQNSISYLRTDRHLQSYPVPSFTNDVARHGQHFLINDDEAIRKLRETNEYSNLTRNTYISGHFVTLPPIVLTNNTYEPEPCPTPPNNESYKPEDLINNLDTVIRLRDTEHDPDIPTIRIPGDLHAFRSTRTSQDVNHSFQYYQNYGAPRSVQSKSTQIPSPPPDYPQVPSLYYHSPSAGDVTLIGSGEGQSQSSVVACKPMHYISGPRTQSRFQTRFRNRKLSSCFADGDELDDEQWGDKYLRHCPRRNQYPSPPYDWCPVEWEASSPREAHNVGAYGTRQQSSPDESYPEYHLFKQSPLFRFDLPPEDSLAKSSDPYAKSYFSAPELANQSINTAPDGSDFWQGNGRGLPFSEFTPSAFVDARYRLMQDIETTLPTSSPVELPRSDYKTRSPHTWDDYVPLRMPPSYDNNQGRSTPSAPTNQESQNTDFEERKAADWLKVMQKISDVERTTKQILEYDWPVIKNRKNTYKTGVESHVHNGLNMKKSYSSVVASRKRIQLTTGEDSNHDEETASSLDYISSQDEETMQNEQDSPYNKLFLYVRGQKYSVDTTNEVIEMFSKMSKESSTLKYVVDPNLLKRRAVPGPLVGIEDATLVAEDKLKISGVFFSAPNYAMSPKKFKCDNCLKAFDDAGLSNRSADSLDEPPTDFLKTGVLRKEQVSQVQDKLKDFFCDLYGPKHLEEPLAEVAIAAIDVARDFQNELEYLLAREEAAGKFEASAMSNGKSAFGGGDEWWQGDRGKRRNLEEFEKYEKLLQSYCFT